MIRRMILLLLGVSFGYFLGFKDARQHDETVLVRTIERVQGVARNTVVDRTEALEDAARDLGR